jgi:hypothetical protein
MMSFFLSDFQHFKKDKISNILAIHGETCKLLQLINTLCQAKVLGSGVFDFDQSGTSVDSRVIV